LQALPEFHSFTEAGFRRAEALLREALRRDPHYADAWAALADCTGRLIVAGWAADWEVAAAQACEEARRAVEADPENGTGLAIAAFTLANLGRKLDQGLELANKALRLHPNSASVSANCAWVFTLGAEYDRALGLFEIAQRMSPLDPRGYFTGAGVSAAYLFSKRFNEAELWTRRTLDKWPQHPVCLRYRVAALVLLGRLEEARSVVAELLKVQPNSSVRRSRRSFYKDQEMFAMYLDALRAAGLPE
jgi:adenylate cyclase